MNGKISINQLQSEQNYPQPVTKAGSVQGETETPDSEGEELTARDVVVARSVAEIGWRSDEDSDDPGRPGQEQHCLAETGGTFPEQSGTKQGAAEKTR